MALLSSSLDRFSKGASSFGLVLLSISYRISLFLQKFKPLTHVPQLFSSILSIFRLSYKYIFPKKNIKSQALIDFLI